MKKIILLPIFALWFSGAFAQSDESMTNDAARITLAAYVPQQIDKMPDAAGSILANKLSQIVTQNGMGGAANNERFIITANIDVISKDLTPTAPSMTALVLEVTLYIGDGIAGTKFSSTAISVKGVGENETKAYITALKGINPKGLTIQDFVANGKSKIIAYYNSKCDFILKEAQTLAGQNKFDEAIFTLVGVPEVCKSCYDKCMDAIAPLYKKQIDNDCKVKLAQATNHWSASQTIEGAYEAAELLSTIDPAAACFGEVKALSKKIAARAKELDAREWKYTLKTQAQESERIKAYRDIGVAFGKGQPKNITYNVRGWW